MKKKLLSSKVKTILILAVIFAILAAVVTAVVSGTPFFTNAVNTILSPIRSGVAAEPGGHFHRKSRFFGRCPTKVCRLWRREK